MNITLKELIDVEQFQMLQDRLNEIHPFPSAIIDNDGTILTATAWQDVCTKFHRTHADCRNECIKSDQYIIDHIHDANPTVSYKCPHGLVDNATPIIIDGVHYGNFFTGQFFLEEPDLDFFRNQAKRFGFDESAYLEAVKKVPIRTDEQRQRYLFFIQGLIEVISRMGLKNLKDAEVQRRIRESEELHRSIVRTTLDGFFLVDLDGRVLEVNESYCKMSGYTEQELTKLRIRDLDAIESSEMSAAHMQRIIENGSERFETRHRRKDGSLYDVSVSVQYLPIQDGRVVAFIQEITDRKRIAEDLQKTTRRLHLATASAKAGVWDWDLQTNEMIWDDRMLELYGLTAANFPGGIEAWTQGLHPEDSTRAVNECQAAIRGERDFDTEFRVRHPDGKILYIKAHGQVLRNEQGTGIRMIGLNTDITERKLAAENMRRMEERLRQSEKMDAIGQLAGGIAHDFNNVLCGIIGYTDMSLGYVEKGSLLENNLFKVLKAAERAKNLVTQILAFSRKSKPQKTITSLHPVIDEVLGLLKSSIPSSVIIASDLQMDTKPVLADPTQIHQALLNLATNAVYAMNRKGTLTVRLHSVNIHHAEISQTGEIVPGEYTAVEIADTGCGIDKATMSKVFEPFFTTKPVGEGTGMGLSVVLGIVQSHGGYIQIESTPGKGTVVRILLPSIESPDSGLIDSDPEALLRGTERILVVDDEEMLVQMNLNALTALGYAVTAFTDSRDALTFLREKGAEIDLLITDQTMPGITGIELAKEALRIRKNFPIILCTGFSSEVDRHNCSALGISKCIMKPYRAREISNAIREVLKNTSDL